MKKSFVLFILIQFILTSCSTKQSLPIEPTIDINVLVATMMSLTMTAIAPTRVVSTETPFPVPTATLLPAGTLNEEFSENFIYPNPDYWSNPFDASLVPHSYKVSNEQGYLKYEFSDPDTYLYTFFEKEMPANINIETSYLTNTQSAEASIVCRVDPVTRLKWYEFRIIHFERAGVIYYFERKDVYHNPYQRLAYVILPVELYKDKENRLEARCIGNKLSLILNGQEVISVEDTKLGNSGLIGLGGVSHKSLPLAIYYNYLKSSSPQ
jgi:hypothetical protein